MADLFESPPPKFPAALLVRLLEEHHKGDEWATYKELADGTGSHKGRTIDFYALHLWPSKGYQSFAYELKVSRNDFRRELDDPTKRAPWEKLATECWYVAPSGVIPVAEVPEGWGLMEWTGEAWRRPRRALQRKIENFPMSFSASLARRSSVKPVEPLEAWQWLGQPIGSEKLMRLAEKLGSRAPRPSPPTRFPWEEDRSENLARAVREKMGGWTIPTAEEFNLWASKSAGGSPEMNRKLRLAHENIKEAMRLAGVDPFPEMP
jgi:hypothetical protein